MWWRIHFIGVPHSNPPFPSFTRLVFRDMPLSRTRGSTMKGKARLIGDLANLHMPVPSKIVIRTDNWPQWGCMYREAKPKTWGFLFFAVSKLFTLVYQTSDDYSKSHTPSRNMFFTSFGHETCSVPSDKLSPPEVCPIERIVMPMRFIGQASTVSPITKRI